MEVDALGKLPKRLQGPAKDALREIMNAPKGADAEAGIDRRDGDGPFADDDFGIHPADAELEAVTMASGPRVGGDRAGRS
jgi:hypothetical protein